MISTYKTMCKLERKAGLLTVYSEDCVSQVNNLFNMSAFMNV